MTNAFSIFISALLTLSLIISDCLVIGGKAACVRSPLFFPSKKLPMDLPKSTHQNEKWFFFKLALRYHFTLHLHK